MPFIVFDKLDPDETVGQVSSIVDSFKGKSSNTSLTLQLVRDATYLQGMDKEDTRSARLHLGTILNKDDKLKTAGLTLESHPLVIIMGLGGAVSSLCCNTSSWRRAVSP